MRFIRNNERKQTQPKQTSGSGYIQGLDRVSYGSVVSFVLAGLECRLEHPFSAGSDDHSRPFLFGRSEPGIIWPNLLVSGRGASVGCPGTVSKKGGDRVPSQYSGSHSHILIKPTTTNINTCADKIHYQRTSFFEHF